jgi:two-component system C4-dicarboxylate transport sensor histidine kinase DctB
MIISPADAHRRLRPGNITYALGLLVALPLCAFPFSALSGLAITVAPFFAILAMGWWNLRRGLAAAVLLTLPSLLLWGEPFEMAAAILQLLIVHRGRQRGLLAAESSAFASLAIGPLAAGFALFWQDMPPVIAAAVALQFALAMIMLAALADMAIVNVRAQPGWRFVALRETRSLGLVWRATINIFVMLIFCLAVGNEVRSIERLHANQRHFADAMAYPAAVRELATLPADGLTAVDLYDGSRVDLYISRDPTDFAARAGRHLSGCPRFAPAPIRSGADAMGRQIDLCRIDRIMGTTGPMLIAISYRDILARQYAAAGPRLAVLLLGGLVALMFRRTLTRAMERTVAASMAFVDRFGTPDLPPPPRLPFIEVTAPLQLFADRHNAYIAAIEDRDRLLGVARSLNRSIGLQLLGDVRFDPDSGRLRYRELHLAEQPMRREIQVHAEDCQRFLAAVGVEEALIEFRPAGGDGLESRLLTVRGVTGSYRWATGLITNTTQPARVRELVTRQARLLDLGMMASTISHEMKQPLFTIAIAAESLQMMLEKYPEVAADPPIAARLARIGEQVGRARDIIERTTRYGQATPAGEAHANLIEALTAAREFLTPMIESRAIEVGMGLGPGGYQVAIPRTALEQVFVNAIQNAADSIQMRRDAVGSGENADGGRLEIVAWEANGMVFCTLTDDGVGLDTSVAETAFDAFFTTKPSDRGSGLGLFISRQIVQDAGGAIRLLPAAPRGATLEVMLPLG